MAASATSACLLIMIGPRAFEDAPAEVVVWITATALFLVAVFGWHISRLRGDNPWIAPAYLVMALYFFRYGWGALVVYYWNRIQWEAYPELRDAFAAGGVWLHVSVACRLALLGACGFMIGFSVRGPLFSIALPRFGWQLDLVKLTASVWACGPAILLLYWGVSSFVPPAVKYPVEVLASVTEGIILLGAYFLCRGGPVEQLKWSAYLAIMYLLALPTALRSGQMVPLLMPGLMAICGHVVARKKLPWVSIILIAPIALYIVLPFAAYYKYAGINTPTESTTVDQRLWVATEAYSQATTRAKLEIALARSVARFSGIPFPARFLQYFPATYPFERGRSFLIEISDLIPRVLWPSKPEVSPELNRYSEEVGMLPRGATTSMVFDGISEYYVNFGDLGVFVLSIVHGWYLSALYRWLVRDGNYLIGSAIFVPLILGNWDFFGVIAIASSHLRILPLWIALYYFMSRRRYEWR
jgi:hypothetical protein